MNKILLIIQREFLNRVQKKSFLLTTILVPLIFPAIMGIMIYIVVKQSEVTNVKTVQVLDDSHKFTFKDSKDFKFKVVTGSLDAAKVAYDSSEDFGLVYIPPFEISDPKGFTLLSHENPTVEQMGSLEGYFEDQVRNMKLQQYKVDQATLDALKTDIDIRQVTKDAATGEEKSSSSGLIYGVGFVLGILIYMFVLIYGIQIMQGVIDEKTSKVVEVIVSSVKPFQLMLGKIIGIASVGLLQFIIWIVLSFGVTSSVLAYFGLKTPQKQMMEQVSKQVDQPDQNSVESKAAQNEGLQKMVFNWSQLPLAKIAAVFVFFFLGGYLLYGSLFAAVGSAVDSIQDAQQFQFPITLPLLIGYMSLFIIVLRDPNSSASFWLSIIPLTSPVAMVGRIASGVPNWELALSMGLLIIGFLFTTWVAGRIYRVGILMTGTKVNYKVLAKWFMTKQ
ncbi:MAG TPA: ABC transporter permease [Cyclobacteriaceae bacterium]|nr:ABC transporter permease [Cyclobacteriaceae bacterium]HMV08311.1 ABC transporter permease [Cyclobacteriaceae bacterium]HMV88412.1 ABC transporter permease [Cyclobacteriaceae bacterium]HMX02154.1 ABC transporter permease [Cyclobacteriaceae bacterium]HMX49870.1 ABC transporter permease [Cyclobacteriaceae bacterium]